MGSEGSCRKRWALQALTRRMQRSPHVLMARPRTAGCASASWLVLVGVPHPLHTWQRLCPRLCCKQVRLLELETVAVLPPPALRQGRLHLHLATPPLMLMACQAALPPVQHQLPPPPHRHLCNLLRNHCSARTSSSSSSSRPALRCQSRSIEPLCQTHTRTHHQAAVGGWTLRACH
jgi:hypothetical protein